MPDENSTSNVDDDAASAAAIESCRSSAVAAVTEAIYAEMGAALAPFGQAGRDYCQQDIHSHLDYLAGSLIAGSAAPFSDYLLWLHSVLDARGVPSDSVTRSVTLLEEDLCKRLTPAQFGAIERILRGGRDALQRPAPATNPFSPMAVAEPHPDTEALTDALANGDQAQAHTLVSACTADLGYVAAAVRLVQPAMYRIGERWQRRELSVAQEHLATALAQKLLVQQFTAATIGPATGSRALFCCVAHNHHALGLQMVADAYELAGWSVDFLGADTPTRDLVEQIAQTRPDIVGLSVSMVRQLPILKQAIDAIRARFGDQTPRLIAGGLGLMRVSNLAPRLGLDGWYPNPLAALDGPV